VRSILEMPAPIEKTANRLPVGRAPLLAFVSDAATEKVLRECLTQLSLANGMILRGGIAKAIETLGAERSPDILIVDISGIDLPISQVDVLAEVCEPGVTVIAIGNRNEIGLYRDLLQAGVTDYIVKPLTSQLIARALNHGTGARGEFGLAPRQPAKPPGSTDRSRSAERRLRAGTQHQTDPRAARGARQPDAH
jgi:DNA-binding response OmpR family regulator